MDTIHVRHVRARQFAGWDEHGHGIVMDTYPEYKGEDTGPRPIELVLYGLAGCTAMDVVSVLEKKRQKVTGVEVRATGTQREDDYPHYYERIDLHYVVTGHDVDPGGVEQAIRLSEDKYCAVKGCFGPQVEVSWTFEVAEAE